MRDEFLRKYPGFEPRRLVVIPNEIHREGSEAEDAPSLHQLFGKARGEVDLVIALGRLVPLKGYHSLISAFGMVHGRHSRARLAIFGEGPERTRLELDIARAGLGNVIRLPGRTDASSSVLSQADVFAMSSRFEGFPMALVEAFSAGIPVVAFDAPGVRDLVADGRSGILVPQGDTKALAEALCDVLADRGLRSRLVEGARAAVDRFSPEKVDRIWFEDVLQAHGQDRSK
jgi:glycosyltransferase involved in cell wall biosynthesis